MSGEQTPGSAAGDTPGQGAEQGTEQVMVVGPDGRPVGTVRVPAGEDAAPTASAEPDAPDGESEELVSQPAKVMRIGTMTKQLLEEVRATELDEPSRRRLAEVHASSLRELSDALSTDLRAELDRLVEPFAGDEPSDGELRIAQAQLVGWLEGLFHGIQTTIVAQQMAAKVQLEQLRRGLPSGAGQSGGTDTTTGQYL